MKLIICLLISISPLMANENNEFTVSEIIEKRMMSMQSLNKLMSQARINIQENKLNSETIDIFKKIQLISEPLNTCTCYKYRSFHCVGCFTFNSISNCSQ